VTQNEMTGETPPENDNTYTPNMYINTRRHNFI